MMLEPMVGRDLEVEVEEEEGEEVGVGADFPPGGLSIFYAFLFGFW